VGITYVEIGIANVSKPDAVEKLEFLVDSGAVYSVVPKAVLKRLRITPLGEESFILANGEKITRKKGGAVFRYNGRVGVADVIFGEKGDATLLGALTLEALGLSLDPLRRELKELPMMLATLERTA
jgi:predicted aspartyl protease